MKKIDVRYLKKSISSAIISGMLAYFLLKTSNVLSKIVILLFFVFGVSFCVRNILLVFRKKELAEKVSKIYVIAFAMYWFGFLICWDYISIIHKEYISVIVSLFMWIGGGYIIYKRWKPKKQD